MIINPSYITPGVNRVLVKIPQGNSVLNLDGVNVEIDISFDPGKHVDVYGTVIAVPDGLWYKKYRGTTVRGSMPHKTEMELLPGDMVYFSYFAAIMALGYLADKSKMPYHEDNMYFIYENEVYILIPYESIFVAVRNEQVIPVNGYILVEPIEINEYDVDYFVKLKEHENIGIVRHVGTPNKEYAEGRLKDTIDIEPGDRILFRKFNNQKIENEIHQNFPHVKPLFKMQRRFVVGQFR